MIVASLHHSFGAYPQVSVIWTRLGVPDDPNHPDIVLPKTLVRRTERAELIVVLFDVIVPATS